MKDLITNPGVLEIFSFLQENAIIFASRVPVLGSLIVLVVRMILFLKTAFARKEVN